MEMNAGRKGHKPNPEAAHEHMLDCLARKLMSQGQDAMIKWAKKQTAEAKDDMRERMRRLRDA